MRILDPLLVEVLLLLQVRYLNKLLLNDICRLLVLPDHVLLVPLKLLELIGHGHYVSVKLLHLRLQFVVALALIHEIVFHVLIDSVDVVFIVENVVDLGRLLDPACQLRLEVSLLGGDALQLLVHKVKPPHETCVVVLEVCNVLSHVHRNELLRRLLLAQSEVARWRGLLSERNTLLWQSRD